MTLRKKIRRLAKRIVTHFVNFPAPPFPDRLIDKAALLIAWSRMEGDYAEFGAWTGNSIVRAYRAFEKAYSHRVAVDPCVNPENPSAQQLQEAWARMKFFAFDSFEGLPSPKGVDLETDAFRHGDFASDLDRFNHTLRRAGIALSDKVVPIKGWFEDTCVPETARSYSIRKLAVAHFDCDLYESTRTALRFVESLLQDGTILIFDDWYCYRGHPDRGEQRAFWEWSAAVRDFKFIEYMKDGCSVNSFICCQA